MVDNDYVRKIILSEIEPKLSKFHIRATEVKDNFDLLETGVLDSLDFLELIEILESKHKLKIDFSELIDPEISRFDVLIRGIVEQNS